MSKNLYITAYEANSGKSMVTMGVMEMLVRNLKKVAFFRPIIDINSLEKKKDYAIDLISRYYHLDTPYRQMYAFTLDKAKTMIAEGKHEELLGGILNSYKELEATHDFVLCLGTDFETDSSSFEFDLNTEIAKNLACPVLVVANAYKTELDMLTKSCQFVLEAFEEKGCNVLSLIFNKTPIELHQNSLTAIKNQLKNKVKYIYSIPYEKTLESITMAEIASSLDAIILHGVSQLNRLVSRFVVAAMNLNNYLPRLTDGSLVITPIDRLDIILGTLAAFRSRNMPDIAGIVLTGYLEPDKTLDNLLEGIRNILPILKVDDDTFTTATKVDEIKTQISPDDTRKTSMCLGLFESNIDTTELRQSIVSYTVSFVTPKMFEFGLIKRARQHKQLIVLPEGEEERILLATEILYHRDAADFILLGDKDKILTKISSLGLDLQNIRIINPSESDKFEEYANTYFELRKHKGITPDNAKDVMSGLNHYGTMMVYKGDADGMVSGAVHSTLHTVRPALEFIKTRPGSTIMSSVFFMCLEDKVLAYADCAVNPRPTAEQLAEIAITTSKTAQIFNLEPKVAMLSYSSGDSGIGTDVDRVKKATKIVKKNAPDLLIEGPIQYDAAVDLDVAMTKLPESKVAGRATVFIFPDLNTGNNTYKAVQRSAKALAIGPIMQGLKKPVNDLSRGCLVPDIVNTIAMTAIQSQAYKGLI